MFRTKRYYKQMGTREFTLLRAHPSLVIIDGSVLYKAVTNRARRKQVTKNPIEHPIFIFIFVMKREASASKAPDFDGAVVTSRNNFIFA
jgi:hypothetical protein